MTVVVPKGGGSGYLVFSSVIITGISDDNYYWYLRAVIITGIVGRRYYRFNCRLSGRLQKTIPEGYVLNGPPKWMGPEFSFRLSGMPSENR